MTSIEPATPTSVLGSAGLLDRYRGVAGHWDEAVFADGSVRPHWQPFVNVLNSQSSAEIQGRQDLCRRILRESGVTYTTPDRLSGDERLWQLDSWPLLISPQEWQTLSAAVAQRARVLNLLLADIYGPGRLLRTGDLPPEILFSNPAFARAAHELRPADGIFLHHYAVDVARSPNGQWWVVADSTDTPTGAGYALENRIVISRVYPELIRDCNVQRLASFFQQLRDGLLARANVQKSEPRVVIYTPGPYNSTYFEQAYLARYLGFNLVEGRDLTVRDDRVYLKTLSGLLPVDVILRRVESDYCDPLELRSDSLLGVPGLLQAARASQVVIANSIGAGVSESPALLPFLANLCRRVLSEDLLLPPIATWWCGQEEALQTVIDQLDRLIVKQGFSRNAPAYLPGQIPKAEMIARLRASPHLYVGQEYVALSTSPTWQEQALIPRHLRIRLYATATSADNYTVMPGGLTRASNSGESIILSVQTGGGSKDTWVLSHAPTDPVTLLPKPGRSSDLSRAGFVLPSRLADDLYWLGRYVERIDFGCRLARCLLNHMVRESELGELAELRFLVDLLAADGRLPHDCSSSDTLEDVLEWAIFDEQNPGSIASDVAKVQRIAMHVRDRLSVDAWRILSDLCDDFSRPGDARLARADEQLEAIARALSLLSACSGQVADGMTRDKGWLFLDIGGRLERVMNLAHLLRRALLRPDAGEGTRLLAVLEIANSAMTYQSRYVTGPDAARVLDLLVSDETNPKSIGFQLATLFQHIRALRVAQTPAQHTPELNLLMNLHSSNRLLDVDSLAQVNRTGRRTRAAARLQGCMDSMRELSSQLTRTYLTHVQASRPMGGPRR